MYMPQQQPTMQQPTMPQQQPMMQEQQPVPSIYQQQRERMAKALRGFADYQASGKSGPQTQQQQLAEAVGQLVGAWQQQRAMKAGQTTGTIPEPVSFVGPR